jgi:nucleoside-diphosphate-sugar epimerase
MRCVIFGGDGFVGYYTAMELSLHGHEVVVCDLNCKHKPELPDVEYRQIDIRHTAELEAFDFHPDDVVIHLAALQYSNKVPRFGQDDFFQNTNYIGTRNLLYYMEKSGCKKMIYFSSAMVYGRPMFLPVTVNHPLIPIGPYGRSKVMGEEMCRAYRELGFNITIFRPSFIYGMGRLGLMTKLLWLIHHNLPVPMIGNGNNRCNMVSAFHCAYAIRLAIEKNIPNRNYNLGSMYTGAIRKEIQFIIDYNNSKSIIVLINGTSAKMALATLNALGINLMHKEQYELADKDLILDTSDTERELNWRAV